MKNKTKLEKWGVRFSAFYTALVGIINMTSAVQPALRNRLSIIEPIIPFEIRAGSRVTSALAGFGLILLARSMWRRKRYGWLLTVILLAISIISHLVKGLDFEEASLSLGLLLILVVLRKSFFAKSDAPSIKQGIETLGLSISFTLVYGSLGFYLLDSHYKTSFNLISATRQVLLMFVNISSQPLEPLTMFGRYFVSSIYIIGISTATFTLVMLLRPVLLNEPATKKEREKATSIVEQFGKTSLARATLFPDKSYFFGTDNTLVAYAVSGSGAIALGDPIGDVIQIPPVIPAFRQYCEKNDWTSAFISVLPDYLDAYKNADYDTACIGFEAIVPTANFTLEGSRNKDLRYAVNHLSKLGYRAKVYQPPLTDELIVSLWDISNAWLSFHKGGEMHFSDGWFDDDYIRNGQVMVIFDVKGKPTAFVNLVEEYQKNEITIDLMRHYPKVEYGTMEFLFSQMILWAKEQKIDSCSLGLSALVGVGEKKDDPAVEKALNRISKIISRYVNFSGLHQFKEKFHPSWEPRYVAYPGAANLPVVINTLIKVHAGKKYFREFLKSPNN